MAWGDIEIIRAEGDIQLLKIECKYGDFAYCVTGKGRTRHYDEYDDALEEFNLRWMKEKYGD